MSTELFYLVLTVMMTAVFWVPYIVNRILENGLWPALKNPNTDEPPKARWAARMIHAHQNAVENLVLFAPLVLAVHVTGSSTKQTALACLVYFWARLAHFFIYTLGVPFFRTLTFFIGFAAQAQLAITLIKL